MDAGLSPPVTDRLHTIFAFSRDAAEKRFTLLLNHSIKRELSTADAVSQSKKPR